MEVKEMIHLLQDPMGIPFYPFIFQFLMVFTFVFHIIFVNLTLGSLLLSLYLSFKREEYAIKLSSASIKMTPPFVSMAILFGIAPLLFVQVLYDPYFYTSSALLGFYVILFIISMMLAYTFVYISYFKKEKNIKVFRIFSLISFILFLFSGFIMHALSFLVLNPNKYVSLYSEGNPVKYLGLNIKYFQISRFLHFIIPSFIMTGLMIMLYSDYFKNRKDFDIKYLEWASKFGSKISFVFIIIQILIGIWFLLEIPFKFRFYTNPLLILGILFSLALTYLFYLGSKKSFFTPKPMLLLSLLIIFFMSYAREILRMNYLSQYDYSIFNYKVNLDIGSTLLFILTFLMGIVVISFLLYISFKAGKTEGEYVAKEKEIKWGKLSILVMIIWLICVVLLGIYVTFKNIS